MRRSKWVAVLLTVTMTMVMVPALAAAGTEADPDIYPLVAGQHLEVGYVEVWDDGVNLYVNYVIAEVGWFLTETHVHVDPRLTGFPRAGRQLNPVPGLFAYSEPNDWDTEFLYTIPIDPVWGCTVLIAAHAVVEKPEQITVISGSITPELTWSRSSELEVIGFPGYGAGWTLAEGFAIATPDSFVWDGGTGATQYFTGYSTRSDVSWSSWQYAQTDPRGGNYNGYSDLRRFNAGFDLSAEIADNITGATLKMPNYTEADVIPINDNVYIFVNEDLLFWGGTRVNQIAGGTFQGMAGTQALRAAVGQLDISDRWYIPGQFPDIDAARFVAGTNNLDVFTEENQTGGGMAELALVVDYEYEVVEPGEKETAWAAEAGGGTRFSERGNWSTYVTYSIAEQSNCIEADLIPAFAMFPGTQYDTSFTRSYGQAAGKVTLCGTQMSISATGLIAGKTYTVFFDTSGVTQGDVTTAGPWAPVGGFAADANGNGIWHHSLSLSAGTHVYSVFINDSLTMLISYNIEFTIE